MPLGLPSSPDPHQARLSAYIGLLFERGDLFDVLELTQCELKEHPEYFDLAVYRSCACLVLLVSGAMRPDEHLARVSMQQLDIIAALADPQGECGGSLGYYMALGYLMLGEFEFAQRTLNASIAADKEHLPVHDNALLYFENRKQYWKIRHGPQLRRPRELPYC